MKGKLIIDEDIEIEIDSNEYDEIMEFLYQIRKVSYKIEDDIDVKEIGYEYNYGILDEGGV